MEISITRKGDLQILSLKGKIRLQNWRVIDKHLDSMLDRGNRWVALDLSEVTLACSTGIGSMLHNVRKFQENDASLILIATTPYMQELFRIFGCEAIMGERIFTDWRSLEKRLGSQGLALKS